MSVIASTMVLAHTVSTMCLANSISQTETSNISTKRVDQSRNAHTVVVCGRHEHPMSGVNVVEDLTAQTIVEIWTKMR